MATQTYDGDMVSNVLVFQLPVSSINMTYETSVSSEVHQDWIHNGGACFTEIYIYIFILVLGEPSGGSANVTT